MDYVAAGRMLGIAMVGFVVLSHAWMMLSRRPARRTWAWCPRCGVDLVGQAAVVRHEYTVLYRCQCGCRTAWLFDAPVPILICEVIEHPVQEQAPTPGP